MIRFLRLGMLVLLGCIRGYSQEKPLSVAFENVSQQQNHFYYEQRLYRNPLKGMVELSKTLATPNDSIAYTPLFQGIPIATYRFSAIADVRPITAIEQKKITNNYRFPLQRNYKFDVWVQPVFWGKFGNKRYPVRSNTSIMLQSQLYLWAGLSVNFGVLFPLTNDLDNRPQIIRPAPLFINQFYKRNNHFVSATVGLFHNDQYGVNLQYRQMDFKSAWSYGVELGLTGMYYYPRGGLYYEKMDKLLALVDVEYRFQKLDLLLKATAGQFIYGDKGLRFDFIRQYSNVEIGLFAVGTQNGATAGFNFAVPIPPGKIIQTKKFQFRTGQEFRWEYLYAGGYRIGERYQTGYQLDQRLRQYHQWYLNRQFKK